MEQSPQLTFPQKQMVGNFSLRAFQLEGNFFELGTSDLSSKKSTEYFCLCFVFSSLLLLLLKSAALQDSAISSGMTLLLAGLVATGSERMGRRRDEKGEVAWAVAFCKEEMRASVEERVRAAGFLLLFDAVD
jgi:hypothetical protein